MRIEDIKNTIICGDCLEVMKQMPDKCVDLVLTSPPYDNLRDYQGYTFNFEGIANELFRIIKEGGVVVWVVGDAVINGSESGTSFKQALYFKEIGFNLHDTMIYHKNNPIPLTHNRYEQCFEYMFVFSKGRPKTFNPYKENCTTEGDYVHRRKSGRVKENSLRAREEITTTKENKIKINLWNYTIGLRGDNFLHPAPFPEKLAIDHIKSWSNEGDIILDPMNGSGTTTKMAKNLKRNFIGIEISEKYCEIARSRLRQDLLI